MLYKSQTSQKSEQGILVAINHTVEFKEDTYLSSQDFELGFRLRISSQDFELGFRVMISSQNFELNMLQCSRFFYKTRLTPIFKEPSCQSVSASKYMDDFNNTRWG